MEKSRKHEIDIYLICIIIFSLFLRLYFMSFNKAMWWDETVYMSKAFSIASGKEVCGWESLRPILLPFSLGAIFKITGVSELLAKVIVISFAVLGIYLFYEIVKKRYDRRLAMMSSLVFSMSWMHLFYSIRIMTDTVSATLFILTIYLYNNMEDSPKKYFLIGFCGVLCFLSRFPTIIVLLVVFLDLFYKKREKIFSDYVLYFTFLGILLPLIAYFAYNYVIYGRVIT